MKSVDQKIIERFSNLLGNEKVRINEPMNRHTTFRIGGTGRLFSATFQFRRSEGNTGNL